MTSKERFIKRLLLDANNYHTLLAKSSGESCNNYKKTIARRVRLLNKIKAMFEL